MPHDIHARADHILAGNPRMPRGEAFAIATKQLRKTAGESIGRLVSAHEAADALSGGLGDSKRPVDFPPVELARGIRVESEHTSKPTIAREIAMDHLMEHPAYYRALAKMEKQLESKEASASFLDELRKIAFSTSQYNGPSGGPPMLYASSQPRDTTQAVARSGAAGESPVTHEIKQAALTPAGQLARTSRVPNLSNKGPSLFQQSSLPATSRLGMRGQNVKLPGAGKGNATLT